MTFNIARYLFLFVLLVLLQALVLNNIRLNGYINPYLYVLFILSLPFNTPRWLVLVLSLLIGSTIDIFSNSMGMHAAACVFMGYIRHHILNIIKPREGYDLYKKPTVKDMGASWYVAYAALLIFFHHSLYFLLEVFRFKELAQVIIRIIISGIFTFLLVLLSQALFGKSRVTE